MGRSLARAQEQATEDSQTIRLATVNSSPAGAPMSWYGKKRVCAAGAKRRRKFFSRCAVWRAHMGGPQSGASHPCNTECVLLGLRDYAVRQEAWGRRRTALADLPDAFGNFLAGLAPWSWFVNPVTFRGDAPCSDFAMKRIGEWLADLQAFAGGSQVGWVIAEEFGALGGRWHCHGLICGVSHLNRRFWWAEAFRRFGRTTIEPFDPERAGTFYAAKYAAKALGKIHFGGTLAGAELSRVVHRDGRRAWDDSLKSSDPSATHEIVASSANVEKSLFRLGLGRWHR